jgi:hypothetical protein
MIHQSLAAELPGGRHAVLGRGDLQLYQEDLILGASQSQLQDWDLRGVGANHSSAKQIFEERQPTTIAILLQNCLKGAMRSWGEEISSSTKI